MYTRSAARAHSLQDVNDDAEQAALLGMRRRSASLRRMVVTKCYNVLCQEGDYPLNYDAYLHLCLKTRLVHVVGSVSERSEK